MKHLFAILAPALVLFALALPVQAQTPNDVYFVHCQIEDPTVYEGSPNFFLYCSADYLSEDARRDAHRDTPLDTPFYSYAWTAHGATADTDRLSRTDVRGPMFSVPDDVAQDTRYEYNVTVTTVNAEGTANVTVTVLDSASPPPYSLPLEPDEKIYQHFSMLSSQYITFYGDTLYGAFDIDVLMSESGFAGGQVGGAECARRLWYRPLSHNYYGDCVTPLKPLQYPDGIEVGLQLIGRPNIFYVSGSSPAYPMPGYMRVYVQMISQNNRTISEPARTLVLQHFRDHAKLAIDDKVYLFRDADHEKCQWWPERQAVGIVASASCWRIAENPFPGVSLQELTLYERPLYRRDVKLIAPVDLRYTATAKEAGELPEAVRLAQNYPNPFNPLTAIEYELSAPVRVRLEVFDAIGRSVGLLVDGMRPAGQHNARFKADGLPSGLYVYRLQAGQTTLTRKMLFAK